MKIVTLFASGLAKGKIVSVQENSIHHLEVDGTAVFHQPSNGRKLAPQQERNDVADTCVVSIDSIHATAAGCSC